MIKAKFITLGYSKQHPYCEWKCVIKKDFPNYIVLDVYFCDVPDEVVLNGKGYSEPGYMFGWLQR